MHAVTQWLIHGGAGVGHPLDWLPSKILVTCANKKLVNNPNHLGFSSFTVIMEMDPRMYRKSNIWNLNSKKIFMGGGTAFSPVGRETPSSHLYLDPRLQHSTSAPPVYLLILDPRLAGNDFKKRRAISRWQNVDSDWAEVTLAGRLFQILGLTTGKAWLSAFDSLTGGTTRRSNLEELWET